MTSVSKWQIFSEIFNVNAADSRIKTNLHFGVKFIIKASAVHLDNCLQNEYIRCLVLGGKANLYVRV